MGSFELKCKACNMIKCSFSQKLKSYTKKGFKLKFVAPNWRTPFLEAHCCLDVHTYFNLNIQSSRIIKSETQSISQMTYKCQPTISLYPFNSHWRLLIRNLEENKGKRMCIMTRGTHETTLIRALFLLISQANSLQHYQQD